jgi:predicted nuclease of predicted toxin-antitoxin system
MTPTWYFDRNADRAVRNGLRRREVDVIDTDDDGTATANDENLLARATELGRVMFTHDDDFLAIAARWRRQGRAHAGIVYVHQLRLGVGEVIDNLEYLSKAHTAEELRDKVTYLPL